MDTCNNELIQQEADLIIKRLKYLPPIVTAEELLLQRLSAEIKEAIDAELLAHLHTSYGLPYDVSHKKQHT